MEYLDLVLNIKKELERVIVGQGIMIERLLIGMLSNGHILIEGEPGLAKTLAVNTLAKTIDAKFSRIQFTPDLLPADITGTTIYNPAKNEYSVRKGPIFANIVLADEINRAPAKVQSALLEAMQEKQVTIGEAAYPLTEPFLVFATQNPLEHEGTYNLPEAQLDRFMLKLKVGYPTETEEQAIVHSQIQGTEKPVIKKVATIDDILAARKEVEKIRLDGKIEEYIVKIVFATRYPHKYGLQDLTDYISYGASPRASINMAMAAKAIAFLKRRTYVLPEDVKEIAKDVLRHRIGITYKAMAEKKDTVKIIDDILSKTPTPFLKIEN